MDTSAGGLEHGHGLVTLALGQVLTGLHACSDNDDGALLLYGHKKFLARRSSAAKAGR